MMMLAPLALQVPAVIAKLGIILIQTLCNVSHA